MEKTVHMTGHMTIVAQSDDDYAVVLEKLQSTAVVSNIVGDAASRTITYDLEQEAGL